MGSLRTFSRVFLILLAFLQAGSVYAEALVVDESQNYTSSASHNYDERTDGSYTSSYAPEGEVALSNEQQQAAGNSTTSFDKLSQMQKEIEQLRGQLETQAHEISQLHKKLQAFYKDIDHRLSLSEEGSQEESPKTEPTSALNLDEGTLQPATETPASNTQSTSDIHASQGSETLTPQITASTTSTDADGMLGEQASYIAAYDLIKERKLDEAITAMGSFLQKYPESAYASNAHYWLGELYLAKKQNDAAVEEFKVVLEKYPTSTKIPAAMLKLGVAYTELGALNEARAQFMKVQQQFPDTESARLAASRLATLNGN